MRGRSLPRQGAAEECHLFVVGSPRSGTTFAGEAAGAQPGWVDLGEVPLIKRAIPDLVRLPTHEQGVRIRRIVRRVQALGLARRLRCVEQTPETSFVLAGALAAFPRAEAVHMVRDGRDVVCSLLERGWLNASREGADDANLAYGAHARFWVEPERREEFEQVSDARRCAWAWRRYVTAARSVPERTIELRYETLVAEPGAAARALARRLGEDEGALSRAFASAHDRSIGRWRSDLTAAQLADVEAEAGDLLAELGYR